jgi:hypothetical protein
MVLDLAAKWPNKGVRQAATELTAGHTQLDDAPSHLEEKAAGRTSKPREERLQPSLF